MLFEPINKLEAMTRDPERHGGDVDRLLQFLESYGGNHFEFEERYMNRYHCPSHEEDIRAHQQFLQVFGQLKAE